MRIISTSNHWWTTEIYTRPFTFSRTWVLGKPSEGLTEYACAENNVDAAHIGPGPSAIGVDGNRGGHPEEVAEQPAAARIYENRKS